MKKTLAICFYIIAILILITYFLGNFIPNWSMSEIIRLILLGGSCFFLYLGGFLQSKNQNNNKPMIINLKIFFALYLLLLVTLTLFDPLWGRNNNNGYNLIPFKTITQYINNFNSLYDTKNILLNLLGNLIAFMPMAFFLPLLFKKQNKFPIFFITMVMIILGIEGVQLISSSGRFDIDDLILNSLGASIMFLILKQSSINKLAENIFLLKNHSIDKNTLLKIIVFGVTIGIIFIAVVLYRDTLYRTNQKKLSDHFNYTLKIIDDVGICEGEKEPFYEDDLSIYYFPCKKSDKVYALINENEKYLVTDLLNQNSTNYLVTLERLESAGLNFIVEDKYSFIPIEIYLLTNDHQKINYIHETEIEDKDLLKVKERTDKEIYNQKSQEYKDSHLNYNLYLIPQKEGKTVIRIIAKDQKTNTIFSQETYDITIDKDFQVKWKKREA